MKFGDRLKEVPGNSLYTEVQNRDGYRVMGLHPDISLMYNRAMSQ